MKKQYDKEKPLISIHIPKCGGSSFSKVLEKWFGGNFYKHYFDEKNTELPTKYMQKPGICIHGHFNKKRGFGVKDYYPEVDQFITMLRDPIQISISNYYFVKKQGGNSYRNGKLYELDDNLRSYLKNTNSFMLQHMPCEITMDNYKEIIEKYFVYVGVLEDAQTSVNVLADKLDFPNFEIEHDNMSLRNEIVPNDIWEEFISRHPLEYAIYNYTLDTYNR